MEKDDNNFYTNGHEYNDKHTENTKTYGMEKKTTTTIIQVQMDTTTITCTRKIQKQMEYGKRTTTIFLYKNGQVYNYKHTENTNNQGKY